MRTDDTQHTVVLSTANGYPPVVGQWTTLMCRSQTTGLSSASAIDQITLSSHSGQQTPAGRSPSTTYTPVNRPRAGSDLCH